MHQFAYNEILEDSFSEARRHEREAFDRVLALLRLGRDRGAGSREVVEGLFRLRQLWMYLIDDLGSPGNLLPDTLRASLISIGIWMIRAADEPVDSVENLDAIIAINKVIRDGLK